MPLRDLNDSKHWRDRAAEMRVLAEEMRDADAACLMHDLANDYDKLADRAAERAKSDFDFSPQPPKPNSKRE
jgi:hypothetical protein